MRIPGLWAAVFAAVAAHAQELKTPSQPQPPAFRLGDAATPLEYAATLAIDPRAAQFSGEVRITMRINRATPVLWLNATNLTIDAAQFEQESRSIPVSVLPGGEDFVGFAARGPHFFPGIATARIRYHAPYELRATRGLFRQEARGDAYVLSQFESIHARRAFPCFDEPGWKTAWRLTIDAPSPEVVASNTPALRSGPAPGHSGWTRHEFAPTKPLPSYLVALAVGPFEVVDGGTAGQRKTKLRYLALKGRGTEARWAKEATPVLLEILEDYFGMPYPFDKLDTVSIPQSSGCGAMETVGLITYSSSLLLATPREETPSFRRRYAAVAAHELAHMWFGNLVTTAWWDDIWLNEAFASWLGDKTLRSYRPEWTRGWSVRYGRSHALELDRLSSARRVRNPVTEKNDLAAAFDSITYQKGAAVLAMFESWFSREAFRHGVQMFLKRHALGNATAEDFIRALGEASGRGAEALAVFRAFIEQPGVPLVDVALDCGTPPALLVEQQRLRASASAAAELTWTTPVCVRQGTTTQCADIANGKSRVQLAEANCGAPLVANAGGRSYYVPRYERSLAERLRAEPDSLSADEMVSSLIDARVLSESGLAPLAEALAWADAGLAHAAPVARLAAVELLQQQRDAWLSPAETVAKREIIARRVRPLAAAMTWEQAAADTEDERELRPRLMSYAAEVDEDGELRDRARELAIAWLAKREAVPATLAPAVLETAARLADARTYQRLESAMLATRDLRERHDLLNALGKVREAKLRERMFAFSLKDDLSNHESLDLLEAALGDDANRRAAFDFLRASYDAIEAKLPQSSIASPIVWLMEPLGRLCTREERTLFADFFRERAAAFFGGPRAYRQGLERIDICIVARAAQ